MANEPTLDIQLEESNRDGEIEVLINGEVFTAYRHQDSNIKKPILFPINAPSGDPITRGYPIEPRSDDRRDHPHHVGYWFTHGNVNGIDFWNNSSEISSERAGAMGTIQHREIINSDEQEGHATLKIHCDWCRPDGSVLVDELTKFTFRARSGARIVDRKTELATHNDSATFHDDKEGLFGLRVARSLELPIEEDLVFVDTAGEETVVTATGDHEVTGRYESSDGNTNSDAWGSRSKWMSLSGIVGDTNVSVTIFDHPNNPGYPTYWMARPYGLFAANPFGPAAFEEDADPLDFTIDAHDNATFRYRLLVQSGDIDSDSLNHEFEQFSATGSSQH